MISLLISLLTHWRWVVAVCLLLVAGAIVARVARRPSIPGPAAFEHLHEGRDASGDELEHDHHHAAPLPREEITARLQQLDREIARNPRDARPIEAKLHFALRHDAAAAVAECERILAEDPKHYPALAHATAGALAQGNMQLALSYAGRALGVRDSAETRLNLGHIYLVRGEKTIAASQFRKALEHEPGNTQARAGLEACGNAR